MKKIIYLILILPYIVFGQVLIEDFEENRNLYYVEKSGEFISDNQINAPVLIGGMYGGVANPDMTGINTSTRCGAYTRNSVETFDYFIALPAGGFTNLNEFTSGENFFTMDVWSPEDSTNFIISFENRQIAQIDPDSTDGVHSRFVGYNTVASGWQTITFNFLDFPDLNIEENQIDQMVILINNGQEGNNVTVYFDNFRGPDFGCDGVFPNNVIEDFECQRNIEYTFTHGALSLVSNPDQTGINESKKVGFYESLGQGDEKGNDVTLFTFDEPLNLSQNNRISIKVKSSFVKNVQLTLQGQGNNYTQELELDGSNEWREYIFNFSDILSDNIAITDGILIFAPGENDFGYNFYYDDISILELSNVNKLNEYFDFNITNNFIYFSNINTIKHVKVYDVAGRLLQDELVSGNHLMLSSKGLLLIMLSDSNGNHQIIKYLNL